MELDRMRPLDFGNQAANESHIVSGRETARVIPMRVEAVGISNDEVLRISQRIEAGELGVFAAGLPPP
jgi:hypothetical protein